MMSAIRRDDTPNFYFMHYDLVTWSVKNLLLTVGKLKGFDCWSPDQDKNRLFLTQTLGSLRTISELPPYSYPEIVGRSATIDVVWFNKRNMADTVLRLPHSFFEIEHSAEFQNSLVKFNDLQDFNARDSCHQSNNPRIQQSTLAPHRLR